MDIKEFAEKFIKAENEWIQQGNFDALAELEDPNVVYHVPPPVGELLGYEAVKQFLSVLQQAISGQQLEWKYLIGEGNLFALSYKSRGMFTGEIPGFPPPTGKEITAYSLMVFRLKDGKIIEVWENAVTTGFG